MIKTATVQDCAAVLQRIVALPAFGALPAAVQQALLTGVAVVYLMRADKGGADV